MCTVPVAPVPLTVTTDVLLELQENDVRPELAEAVSVKSASVVSFELELGVTLTVCEADAGVIAQFWLAEPEYEPVAVTDML